MNNDKPESTPENSAGKIPLQRLVSWLESRKVKGDWIPTCFDIVDLWRENSTRAGGRFNMVFFWLYPLFFTMAIPVTIFSLLEAILGTDLKDS